MTEAERRAIEADVTRLLHHYMHLNDAQDWEAVADLFLPDARMRRPSGGEPAVGRAAILAGFRDRPPRSQRHVAANILVTAEGPATARVESVLVLYHGPPASGDGLPVQAANSPLIGWYRDLVVLTADGWRFAERIGGLDFAA